MCVKDILAEGAKEYNINLSDIQIDQMEKYMNLVKEWNKKINLTAITDDREFVYKHLIDSISIVKSGVISGNKSLIDVGTGAGFPGIPVKIIFPDIDVVLLDSLNKRIKFLELVINELGLRGIRAIHSRAEDGARQRELREKFDIATARAVANMTVLSEYCIPYVKKGGYFVALKGPAANDEINEARNAIGTLGGKLTDIIDIEIKGSELNHKLVVIEKINNTSDRYPRKPGVIEKKPIK